MNWREMPLVILDTETTGLDPAVSRVIEVAAVRMENWRITGRFSSLVSIDGEVPPESTEVHGITNEMLRDAPVFADIALDLVAMIESAPCVVAAYNGNFDRAMLIAEFHRCGITPPAFLCGGDRAPWLDVCIWARALHPYASGSGRYKLGSVAQRVDVQVSEAHRALGDCETTARILAAMRDLPMHRESLCKRIPELMDDVVLQQGRLRGLSDADHFYFVATKRREERMAANG